MELSEVSWPRTEWFPDRAYRCARVTKSLLTWKTIWREWKLRYIGTAYGKEGLNITTVCRMWRSVPYKRVTHSGMHVWPIVDINFKSLYRGKTIIRTRAAEKIIREIVAFYPDTWSSWICFVCFETNSLGTFPTLCNMDNYIRMYHKNLWWLCDWLEYNNAVRCIKISMDSRQRGYAFLACAHRYAKNGRPVRKHSDSAATEQGP